MEEVNFSVEVPFLKTSKFILINVNLNGKETKNFILEKFHSPVLTERQNEFSLFIKDYFNENKGYWILDDQVLVNFGMRQERQLFLLEKQANINVFMLDGVKKVLRIDQTLTVDEIKLFVGDKIGLECSDEYSLCYKKTDSAVNATTKKVSSKTMKTQKDDIVWLLHNKTLSEQEVPITTSFYLLRKYFYEDNFNIINPKEINLLYNQCRDGLLGGSIVCSYKDICKFGAYQIQIERGKYRLELYKSGNLDISRYIPKIKNKTLKMTEKIIHDIHMDLLEKDQDATRFKFDYITMCQNLPTYGITLFQAHEPIPGKYNFTKIYLGISKSEVITLDENSLEIIKTWPLMAVRSWSVGKNSFSLDFGTYSETKYLVYTPDGEKIAQAISGYIDLIMKKNQEKEKEGINRVESTVIRDMVLPKRGIVMTPATKYSFMSGGCLTSMQLMEFSKNFYPSFYRDNLFKIINEKWALPDTSLAATPSHLYNSVKMEEIYKEILITKKLLNRVKCGFSSKNTNDQNPIKNWNTKEMCENSLNSLSVISTAIDRLNGLRENYNLQNPVHLTSLRNVQTEIRSLTANLKTLASQEDDEKNESYLVYGENVVFCLMKYFGSFIRSEYIYVLKNDLMTQAIPPVVHSIKKLSHLLRRNQAGENYEFETFQNESSVLVSLSKQLGDIMGQLMSASKKALKESTRMDKKCKQNLIESTKDCTTKTTSLISTSKLLSSTMDMVYSKQVLADSINSTANSIKEFKDIFDVNELENLGYVNDLCDSYLEIADKMLKLTNFFNNSSKTKASDSDRALSNYLENYAKISKKIVQFRKTHVNDDYAEFSKQMINDINDLMFSLNNKASQIDQDELDDEENKLKLWDVIEQLNTELKNMVAASNQKDQTVSLRDSLLNFSQQFYTILHPVVHEQSVKKLADFVKSYVETLHTFSNCSSFNRPELETLSDNLRKHLNEFNKEDQSSAHLQLNLNLLFSSCCETINKVNSIIDKEYSLLNSSKDSITGELLCKNINTVSEQHKGIEKTISDIKTINQMTSPKYLHSLNNITNNYAAEIIENYKNNSYDWDENDILLSEKKVKLNLMHRLAQCMKLVDETTFAIQNNQVIDMNEKILDITSSRLKVAYEFSKFLKISGDQIDENVRNNVYASFSAVNSASLDLVSQIDSNNSYKPDQITRCMDNISTNYKSIYKNLFPTSEFDDINKQLDDLLNKVMSGDTDCSGDDTNVDDEDFKNQVRLLNETLHNLVNSVVSPNEENNREENLKKFIEIIKFCMSQGINVCANLTDDLKPAFLKHLKETLNEASRFTNYAQLDGDNLDDMFDSAINLAKSFGVFLIPVYNTIKGYPEACSTVATHNVEKNCHMDQFLCASSSVSNYWSCLDEMDYSVEQLKQVLYEIANQLNQGTTPYDINTKIVESSNLILKARQFMAQCCFLMCDKNNKFESQSYKPLNMEELQVKKQYMVEAFEKLGSEHLTHTEMELFIYEFDYINKSILTNAREGLLLAKANKRNEDLDFDSILETFTGLCTEQSKRFRIYLQQMNEQNKNNLLDHSGEYLKSLQNLIIESSNPIFNAYPVDKAVNALTLQGEIVDQMKIMARQGVEMFTKIKDKLIGKGSPSDNLGTLYQNYMETIVNIIKQLRQKCPTSPQILDAIDRIYDCTKHCNQYITASQCNQLVEPDTKPKCNEVNLINDCNHIRDYINKYKDTIMNAEPDIISAEFLSEFTNKFVSLEANCIDFGTHLKVPQESVDQSTQRTNVFKSCAETLSHAIQLINSQTFHPKYATSDHKQNRALCVRGLLKQLDNLVIAIEAAKNQYGDVEIEIEQIEQVSQMLQVLTTEDHSVESVVSKSKTIVNTFKQTNVEEIDIDDLNSMMAEFNDMLENANENNNNEDINMALNQLKTSISELASKVVQRHETQVIINKKKTIRARVEKYRTIRRIEAEKPDTIKTKTLKQQGPLKKIQHSLQQRSKHIRNLFNNAQSLPIVSKDELDGYFDTYIEKIITDQSKMDSILEELQAFIDNGEIINDSTWESFHSFINDYNDRVTQSGDYLGAYKDSVNIKENFYCKQKGFVDKLLNLLDNFKNGTPQNFDTKTIGEVFKAMNKFLKNQIQSYESTLQFIDDKCHSNNANLENLAITWDSLEKVQSENNSGKDIVFDDVILELYQMLLHAHAISGARYKNYMFEGQSGLFRLLKLSVASYTNLTYFVDRVQQKRIETNTYNLVGTDFFENIANIGQLYGSLVNMVVKIVNGSRQAQNEIKNLDTCVKVLNNDISSFIASTIQANNCKASLLFITNTVDVHGDDGRYSVEIPPAETIITNKLIDLAIRSLMKSTERMCKASREMDSFGDLPSVDTIVAELVETNIIVHVKKEIVAATECVENSLDILVSSCYDTISSEIFQKDNSIENAPYVALSTQLTSDVILASHSISNVMMEILEILNLDANQIKIDESQILEKTNNLKVRIEMFFQFLKVRTELSELNRDRLDMAVKENLSALIVLRNKIIENKFMLYINIHGSVHPSFYGIEMPTIEDTFALAYMTKDYNITDDVEIKETTTKDIDTKEKGKISIKEYIMDVLGMGEEEREDFSLALLSSSMLIHSLLVSY